MNKEWGRHWNWILGASLVFGLGGALVRAQDRERRNDSAYESLIERLELGITALDELGRHDARELLERIADEVRGERRAAREVNRAGLEDRARRVDILRMARNALAEAGDEHAAGKVERVVHVGELQLAGGTDEEISRAARGLEGGMGHVIELCQLAAGVLREHGHAERAELVNALAGLYAQRERERARGETPPEQDEGAAREREVGRRELEVLRVAFEVLKDSDERGPAERMEHAIHARELGLEGRDDPEAMRVRRSGPPRPELVELLRRAAQIYAERGWETNAGRCAELAERWGARELRRRTAEYPFAQLVTRVQRLEDEVAELRRRLRERK